MFDSGIIKVYAVSNNASPGYKPVRTYEQKATLAYDERTVGAQRYAAAQQHDVRLSAIVRTPATYDVLTDDVAVLEPFSHEDGALYRVYQVQQVIGETGLPATDISLERLSGIQAADVVPEPEPEPTPEPTPGGDDNAE